LNEISLYKKSTARKFFLVGFMATGKTTVGKKLSSKLNIPFFDSDREIELILGCSINEYFRTHGETKFREIEKKTIIEKIKNNNDKSFIMSLGGGAYLNHSIRKLINFVGISIWLNGNIDIIYNRLKKSKNERPLIVTFNTKEKLEKLLNENFNDDFNILRDEALLGNKYKTNSLLSETEFEIEKNVYYLNLVNQRLNRLKEVNIIDKKGGLTEAINNLKPPIFWKDKPVFEKQAKIWTSDKIHKILRNTHKIEIDLKSNNVVSKTLLIKKLMIDICEIATA